MDSIHDMNVMNNDAISYQSKPPEKGLETADQENKKKYLHTFINERWNFTHFVASVDGLLGVDAEVTLERIARRLTSKWKYPYSRIYGYVKSKVDINLFRATH